ncbi:MAG: hypothetical protein ACRD2O_12865, partial [Terriglobia bacterium]
MRILASAVLSIALMCAPQAPAASQPQSDLQSQPQATTTSPQNSTITIPPGTAVVLALTRPIWSRTAKPGDPVYAETAFPVAINNDMAIPPGTYVEGQIDSIARPGWLSPHAQFQFHFTKMIFANDYTVVFPGPQNITTTEPSTGMPSATPNDVIAAVATPYVQVSSASDILLDNGSQIEMI